MRTPCGLTRGAWTASEDKILSDYIKLHGEGKRRNHPINAGLKRCGKSCRLRWLNYLRPDIKRGNISLDEEDLIIRLHKLLGNRWSLIAGRIPGRTDNEIKNYWNTTLAKKVNHHGNIKKNNKKKVCINATESTLSNDSNEIRTYAVGCIKPEIVAFEDSIIPKTTESSALQFYPEDENNSSNFVLDIGIGPNFPGLFDIDFTDLFKEDDTLSREMLDYLGEETDLHFDF